MERLIDEGGTRGETGIASAASVSVATLEEWQVLLTDSFSGRNVVELYAFGL